MLSTQQETTDERSQYYTEQCRSLLIDYFNAHDVKIDYKYKELLNKFLVTEN